MKGIPMSRLLFVLLIASVVSGWALLVVQSSYADALEALHSALPEKIRAWTVDPEDQIFDANTIFSYIDGAGEVYRAYNMRRCLSRRYSLPKGPAIVLDIFDMGTSADAFGVFTHDQDGEEMNLGQGALYRPGWLSFWKDRFFVSIYMEEESTEAELAVRELGKTVASLIKKEGPKPRILSELPRKGLRPKSVRYLHHHIVLNYHFYVSDENILNLGPRTDAILAEYEQDGERARLLLVKYPDRREAMEALAQFRSHYLPDADSTGIVLQENGKWSAGAVKGKLLAAIFEADSRKLAEDILSNMMKRSPKT